MNNAELSKLSDALLDIQYINTPHNRHIIVMDGNVSLTHFYFTFLVNSATILLIFWFSTNKKLSYNLIKKCDECVLFTYFSFFPSSFLGWYRVVWKTNQCQLENPVSSERSDDIIIPFTNSELSHQHMCIILVNIYSFINLFFLCCRKFVSYVQAISIYCIVIVVALSGFFIWHKHIQVRIHK